MFPPARPGRVDPNSTDFHQIAGIWRWHISQRLAVDYNAHSGAHSALDRCLRAPLDEGVTVWVCGPTSELEGPMLPAVGTYACGTYLCKSYLQNAWFGASQHLSKLCESWYKNVHSSVLDNFSTERKRLLMGAEHPAKGTQDSRRPSEAKRFVRCHIMR